MPAPRKPLADLVRDRSFRARRDTHRERLDDSGELPWPQLDKIRRRYQRATRPATRDRIALEFERAVRGDAGDDEPPPLENGRPLSEILDELGPPGSAERVINFFPRFLFHTKGPLAGQPFELEEWQKDFIREAFRRDRHGRRVYQRIYLYVPGGNGKTPLAAGLGLLALCELEDAPEIFCVAGAKTQATIGWRFAETWVRGTDKHPAPLAQWLRVKGGKIINRATGGEMVVTPASGALLEGASPSVVIVDELHAFEHERHEETYVAFTGKLHKRGGEAYLIGISTAGRGDEQLLRRILLAARAFRSIEQRDLLTIYRDREAGILVWAYEAPAEAPLRGPEGLDVIRRVNPGSWLNPREIVRQLADAGAGEAEFRRLARNEWIAKRHAWLPVGAWGRLKVVDEPPPRGTKIVLGFDGSYNNDATGLVGWARPDHFFVLGAWERPKNDPDWVVPRAEVTARVDWAMEYYDVEHLVADPPGWFEEVNAWAQRYGDDVVVKFATNETAMMAAACREFYAAVVNNKHTTHDGDEVLARHIANARTRETADGAIIVKERRDSPLKIDLAVAAVVARYTGLRVKKKKRRRVVSWA